MGPATAIKTGFAKSFQFSGRASRSEFWWFAGLLVGVTFVLLWPFATILATSTVDVLVTKTSAFSGETERAIERRTEWHLYKITWTPISIAIVGAFYCLIAAATARRLHDVGSSAWFGLAMLLIGPASTVLSLVVIIGLWQLFPALATFVGFILIPISWLAWLICPLILCILLTRPSEEGTTEYGPNPNEVPQ